MWWELRVLGVLGVMSGVHGGMWERGGMWCEVYPFFFFLARCLGVNRDLATSDARKVFSSPISRNAGACMLASSA